MNVPPDPIDADERPGPEHSSESAEAEKAADRERAIEDDTLGLE